MELEIEMEAQDVAPFTAHIELAGQLGLPERKLKLEEMAAEEARHGREWRRLLKGL